MKTSTHAREAGGTGAFWRRPWAAVALIAFAGLLVFHPGASGDFIYDDHVDIQNVDNVFAPDGWRKLWVTASAQLYRPVKYLSYYVDNRLFGWSPRGWHWHGFVLHAINGVLIWLLARRLGVSLAGAFLGGLWFAVHPIHAEAVVWISSRASVLSTLGVLAMLLFYDRWRRGNARGDLLGLTVSAVFGFFSKEDALMIFPLIALYEWFIRHESPVTLMRDRKVWLPLGIMGVIAAVYLGLRQSILTGLKQGEREGGLLGWIATLPVILVTYIRQLIWPDPMCIDQPVNPDAGFGVAFGASLLLLAAAAAFLFLRRRELSPWQFALGFFFVSLIPVMGIIPINQPRADRFLYLPSVAAALALGWLADRVWNRPEKRALFLTAFLVSITWYSWRSWDYSKTFRSDFALWENVINVNARSYRGYANMATIANNANKPDVALELAGQSLAINPRSAETLVTKAYSLAMLGRTKEAEEHYRQALKASEDARWLFLLADLLQRQQRFQEAEVLFDRIAVIRPGYVSARLAAGLLAIDMNLPDKAEMHWSAILEFDPNHKEARHNLEVLRRKRAAAP